MPKSDLVFTAGSYAPVADRVTQFYKEYPRGRINTELVSRENGEITFKALVFRDVADMQPAATGWAAEREDEGEVNAVACLENTETSAVGRALANLGFTASAQRPSREEMEKVDRARRRRASMPEPVHRPQLQEQADAALDLLDLLGAAQRRGFPPGRAMLLREHVNRIPPLAPERIQSLERRLRRWLRRTL